MNFYESVRWFQNVTVPFFSSLSVSQGRVPPTGYSLAADWLSAGGAVLLAVARRQPSALPAGQTAGPHGRIQPVQCKHPINQLPPQSALQSINQSVSNGSVLGE